MHLRENKKHTTVVTARNVSFQQKEKRKHMSVIDLKLNECRKTETEAIISRY